MAKFRVYEVEYQFYQYSSGCNDNGTFTSRRECDSLAQAVELAKKINAAAKSNGDLDKEAERLIDDLIPNGGSFHWAKAIRTDVEETEIDLSKPLPNAKPKRFGSGWG